MDTKPSRQDLPAIITADMLCNAGPKLLRGKYHGVLSFEEGKAWSKEHRNRITIMQHSIEDKAWSVPRVFYVTDQSLFGYGIMPREWTSCSSGVPYQIKPRPGYEDGYVHTYEQYLKLFHEGEHQIQSLKELLIWLNLSPNLVPIQSKSELTTGIGFDGEEYSLIGSFFKYEYFVYCINKIRKTPDMKFGMRVQPFISHADDPDDDLLFELYAQDLNVDHYYGWLSS